MKGLHLIASLVANLGGLMIGTGISWTSPMISRIPFKLTPGEISWMVSIRSIGSIVSAIPAGYAVNKIGRKPALVFSAVPGLISWLLIAFTRSIAPLLIARFLLGMSTAVFTCVTPIYIGEVADPRYRGILATLMALMLNIGQLFELFIGPYVDYTTLALLSVIFPIVFLVLMLFMPETPTYYVLKECGEKAGKSISKLRGDVGEGQIQEELTRTKSHVDREKNERSNIKDLLQHRGPRRALIIILALFSFQHFSGFLSILAYAAEIFRNSGSEFVDHDVAAMIVGCFQTAACIVCTFFVDRCGRRPLLLISTIGCGISLIVAGMFSFLKTLNVALHSVQWLPLLGIIGYLVMFNAGIGPLPFVLESEMFPPNMKGLAISICSVYIGIAAFIVTKAFPHLEKALGQYVLFWIFAMVCFLGTVFAFLCVPETKGKTIASIVTEMKSISSPQPPSDQPSHLEVSAPEQGEEEKTE